MDGFLFGAAYYDEYMPTPDRLGTDIEMMKAIGVTTVRIAESTWSTLEPQPGVFDFSHVDRVIEAMTAAGIRVIVGTPTYAVPTWLVASHPEVLAQTPAGPGRYGARQIMDIINPAYRFHAERVIRALISRTAEHPGVIGFQVDNETKYYDSVSADVQRAFVKHLRDRFDDDLGALNAAFGLDYWSNRINAWEDFPDVTGTVNGSLAAAFDSFRRDLVTEFLSWQVGIVRQYARPDQFITQNFDFDWAPGWSYGVQPSVDHFKAARVVDVAGVDIYHPTESSLTGKEIAFGGDIMRSVKDGANYLVLETQAQGQMGWLPYPGQLRLQAYSHVASGADGVMYWHWHSIHNSFETYWKGLLSQDLEPNPTYEEAGVFGREIAEHGDRVAHLRIRNRAAIMISNESLTALRWFTIEHGFVEGAYGSSIGYNDVFRWIHDALFDLNIGCDIVPPDASVELLSRYDLLVTPALYVASQSTLDSLRDYVAQGGCLVSTFRSFVADEDVTVWADRAPHSLRDVMGMGYSQFTRPEGGGTLALRGVLAEAAGALDAEMRRPRAFLELLRPEGAEVLATYDHPAWRDYAAVTRHRFGRGTAVHVGTFTSPEVIRAVLRLAAEDAGIIEWPTGLAGRLSVRRGVNRAGHDVTYLLNYHPEAVTLGSPVAGADVLGGTRIEVGQEIVVGPWDLTIVES